MICICINLYNYACICPPMHSNSSKLSIDHAYISIYNGVCMRMRESYGTVRIRNYTCAL